MILCNGICNSRFKPHLYFSCFHLIRINLYVSFLLFAEHIPKLLYRISFDKLRLVKEVQRNLLKVGGKKELIRGYETLVRAEVGCREGFLNDEDI